MTAVNTDQPEGTAAAAVSTAAAPVAESTTRSLPAVYDGDDADGSIEVFSSHANFRAAARMADALSKSTVVPEIYRGSPANCLVALELASRTGASVMMVMQNLFVIEGRPSWASAFLIASVNSSGRFTPLRFQIEGVTAQPGWRCRAIARDLKSGDVLEGEWITHEMAKAEGWYTRRASKWATMPGQMIRYRAAAFWTRVYCPEISLGMHTADEVEDFAPMHATATAGVTSLNEALGNKAPEPPKPASEPAEVVEDQEDLLAGDRELLRSEGKKR